MIVRDPGNMQTSRFAADGNAVSGSLLLLDLLLRRP